MTAGTTGHVERADQELRGTFTARLESGELRVGEECWLQLRIEAVGGELFVASGTDRRTGRPTPLELTGDLDGAVLVDPQPAGTGIGGPMGAVAVTPDSPWERRVLVDQFLRLPDPAAGRPSARPGRLRLLVRRPLPIARNAPAALTAGSESLVEVELIVTVRPDDAAAAPQIPDQPPR